MHFFAEARARLDPDVTRLESRGGHAAFSPPSAVMPWLAVEQFRYDRQDQLAVLRLLAMLDGEFGAPAGSLLIVQNGSRTCANAPFASSTSCPRASNAHSESQSGLLWQASFAVPLDVVEYPQATFSLTADDHLAIALPAPLLALAQASVRGGGVRLSGARVRRHLAALTAGFAIVAAPGWAVGVANAATVSHPSSQHHAGHDNVLQRSPATTHSTTSNTHARKTTAPTNANVPALKSTRHKSATTSVPAKSQNAAPKRTSHSTDHSGTREHSHSDHQGGHGQGGHGQSTHSQGEHSKGTHSQGEHSKGEHSKGKQRKGKQSQGEHSHGDHQGNGHHRLHANTLGTHNKGAHHDRSKPKTDLDHRGQSHPAQPAQKRHHDRRRHQSGASVSWSHTSPAWSHASEPQSHTGKPQTHAIEPQTKDKRAHHDRSKPDAHGKHRGHSHHHGLHQLSHVSADATVPTPPAPAPAPTIGSPVPAPVAPTTTGDSANLSTIAGWLGLPASSASLPAGQNVDLFNGAELGQTSSLLNAGAKPPAYLIPIYKAAARRYRLPWQILAAINWVETDYGRDLNTSPAGAIGWMQFMPGTWQEYGIVADGNSRPNPYSPRDAIFSAARYLAANGGARNLPKAIYAYNHAVWYVAEVLWRAQVISDHLRAHVKRSLAGTGRKGLAGAETMLVAAFSAVGGPYSQANHDSFGQSAAELRRAGTDCSGFVSWVLDQVDPRFGNQTTVTLPDQPGIRPGVGQYVTMWDRPLPGDQGHVIINILGTWFESGGNSAYNAAGGISPMTENAAVGELTGGGFLPYNLKGL